MESKHDFFKPIVEKEKQHFNFIQLIEEEQSSIRDTFNEWAMGFVDRDGKLIKEFQTTFNSTFWEVYLHALFCSGGLKVDYSKYCPDFCLHYKNFEICIEAVVSNAAWGELPEWHKDTFKPDWKFEKKTSKDYAELNRNAMIRHSNAICGKFEKYNKSYKNLEHVKGRPFVIALGAYDSPNCWEEMDRAIMAVLYDYYIDEQDAFDGQIIHNGQFPVKSLGSITKKNGATVCLGLFNSPRMKEVSAVAFSCTATVGKLRALSKLSGDINIFVYAWRTEKGISTYTSPVGTERLGDGLMIFHNPFAENPLPQEPFEIPGVSHYYFDDECGFRVACNGPVLMTRAHVFFSFTGAIGHQFD